MSAINETRVQLVDQLENARTKASRLMLRLKYAGLISEADQAAALKKTIGRQIEEILSISMDEWSGVGQDLLGELISANRKLQQDITDITNKRNTAQKVVGAMGRLEEIIKAVNIVLRKI